LAEAVRFELTVPFQVQ